MPSANPIVEGIPGRGPVAAAPPTSEPSGSPAMSVGGLEGFTHPDNTAVHAAVIVGIAFGIVLFLYWGGFKFAVDAGVTRP